MSSYGKTKIQDTGDAGFTPSNMTFLFNRTSPLAIYGQELTRPGTLIDIAEEMIVLSCNLLIAIVGETLLWVRFAE